MLRAPFGRAGPLVPVIGQGTWKMEEDDRASAVSALRAGIELGMTHIDTAELYGRGRVEAIVADVIEKERSSLFLVSKVMPQNATRKGTLQACERSLKALRTEYLDCYLLHWASSHPLEETLSAFEELVSSGKIRSYGVSNFDERELAEAVAIAGPGKIACNQVLYNLGERSIEHAVLPYCEAQGIAVVGYTPLDRTRFRAGGADNALTLIAKKHGKTPRQIALSFLTRRPSLFTIPKASNPAHTRENAGASGIELDASDLAAIDKSFPLGPRRPGVASI
jgi:diketogulonate reductase-like aldo/keto reductase